jgi:hypothetical protein
MKFLLILPVKLRTMLLPHAVPTCSQEAVGTVTPRRSPLSIVETVHVWLRPRQLTKWVTRRDLTSYLPLGDHPKDLFHTTRCPVRV